MNLVFLLSLLWFSPSANANPEPALPNTEFDLSLLVNDWIGPLPAVGETDTLQCQRPGIRFSGYLLNADGSFRMYFIKWSLLYGKSWEEVDWSAKDNILQLRMSGRDYEKNIGPYPFQVKTFEILALDTCRIVLKGLHVEN